METAYRRCCGIDVHKKSVTVHVLPPVSQPGGNELERQFRTFTRDLRRLRAWLKQCRVTEVVMESTGQYWKPIWNILEAEGPRLVLVNPAHVKALAGRKTDRIDSRRIARYLERGELDGSFVPPRDIRELRDLTRLRVHLLEEVNRVKNRIGQMCEAGNIKVSSVASDLFGVSGRRMLQALIIGLRDPGWMADYARGRLRHKRQCLAEALHGTLSDHQRWLLGQELKHLAGLEQRIAEVEQQVEIRMQPHTPLIQRLMTIPGVDRIVAWTMVAELGPDMHVFPDADHVVSWAGLCPGNCESAGKRLGGRTRKANPYLRRSLCQAAWAASHTKNTYLSALYRRMRGRIGHNQANVAVAHQILRTAYTMLLRREDYREMGSDYYDLRNKPRVVNRLVARLSRLGYEVELHDTTDANSATVPEQHCVPEATAATADSPKPMNRKRGRPCKCAERGIPCSHQHNNSELRNTQVAGNAAT